MKAIRPASILVAILVATCARTSAQIPVDGDTLLLLRFDGDANGALSETPSVQANLSYVNGVYGQGAQFTAASQLVFDAASRLNALEGTLDFWIKPIWDGGTATSPFFLEWGDAGGLLACKNNQNLRTILNRYAAGGNPEAGIAFGDTGDLRGDEWIHLAFTWSSANQQTAVYLNGIRFAESTFSFPLPMIPAASFQIGGSGENSAAGVIDEFRISNRVRTDAEILAVYRAGQAALGRGTPPAPDGLTEGSAASWGAQAELGSVALSDDTTVTHEGTSSIKLNTDGGFDTWVLHPGEGNAFWDFLQAGSGGLAFWARARNSNNPQFQNGSPWIRLFSAAGHYFELRPNSDILNEAIDNWHEFMVPFAGDSTWQRLVVGRPSLHQINRIEIHADTWGAGFDLWIDGLRFNLPPSPPDGVKAFAGNGSVELRWKSVDISSGLYSGYAIYRDSAPFTTVGGRTPIATIDDLTTTARTDNTATNDIHWYYAVVARLAAGGVTEPFISIGPRTPRVESDLQVAAISRTPGFPRYEPTYTDYNLSEPGGFGPYVFSAATGLGGGQTAETPRFPAIGDPVTYTAAIRNRGTLRWSGSCAYTWSVDNVVAGGGSLTLNLAPGETATVPLVRTWDNADHEIRCNIAPPADARASNNSLAVWTKSVPFLTYVDRTYAEEFREKTAAAASPFSDDIIDWLQHHKTRFNALLEAAGTRKRVHYDIVEILDDDAPDPATDRRPYAIFPFRFRAGEGQLRDGSGYYSAADDIDYGLLHEEGHQLGLIDIYRLNLGPSQNLVSGMPYNAPACLMNGCSHFLSAHSAAAMEHWADTAHGYYGQYIYSIPETVRLRFLRPDGAPLAGASVKMYQKIERAGVGEIIPDEIKVSGTTDADGVWTLPNVPVDAELVPTTDAGDTLHANPFGNVAVIGTNGLLHFRIEFDGATDWAWLDITETNVAYFQGQTTTATFTRSTTLGGARQAAPPTDLAEFNADSWTTYAADGTFTAAVDTDRVHNGGSSIRFDATGGFLNIARYPGARNSHWDLSGVQTVRFWAYAEDSNTFQDLSPRVRIYSGTDYFEYTPPEDLLNTAIGQWTEFVIPIAGDATWTRTASGTPNMADATALAIHSDTWGAGYTLWLDGVRFDPQAPGALDFLTWAETQPIPPIARGPETDADGDGVPNFLEFALGGSNDRNDASVLPTGTREPDGFHFTWRQAKGIGGVAVTPERSEQLAVWSPVTATPELIDDNEFFATWSITEPLPLTERLFLRLRVSAQP